MKQVCAAFLLFAMMAGLPASAQIAGNNAPIAGTPANFCSGKLDRINFIDADEVSYAATREGDKVWIYRQIIPESGDWQISDNYLFSFTSRKLIQFSRVIGYAQFQNVYVQIVNAGSVPVDNAASLPDYIYVPEIEALQSLMEFCQLKVE